MMPGNSILAYFKEKVSDFFTVPHYGRIDNRIFWIRSGKQVFLEARADLPLDMRLKVKEKGRLTAIQDGGLTYAECNGEYLYSEGMDVFPGKNYQIHLNYERKSDVDLDRDEDETLVKRAELITRGRKSFDEKMEALFLFLKGFKNPYMSDYQTELSNLRTYTIDHILTHNVAHPCSKVNLFVDMCRSIGIPARRVEGWYDTYLKGASIQMPKETLESSNWAMVFKKNRWVHADPNRLTIGDTFDKRRYYLLSGLILEDCGYKLKLLK